MRIFWGLLLACGVSVAVRAQVVAVNPTTNGGFESGTTFASNGWTVVNPAAGTNQWILSGSAIPFAGARGAHISDNASAYQYNNSAAATCHFYRDIAIPAGVGSITLNFQWKGFGQSGFDRMLAYTAPTSVVPVANSPVSPATTIVGATQIWSQPSFTASSYISETLTLSSALAGTTVRLIFSWQNNASGGTTPGGAIDNISLTYDCGAAADIIGTDKVCVTSAITLSAGTSTGSWSSSATGIAQVGPTGIVTGMAPGTCVISYSVSGCPTTTKIISVDPVPAVITGNGTVCTGANTTFANVVIGGSWSSGSPTIASVLSGSGLITGVSEGNAVITYAMPAGCKVTRPVSVVNPPTTPIAGSREVCPGTTTTLSHPTGGGSWLSLNPGSATVNAGTGLVTGIVADTANIVYTTGSGCRLFATVTIHPLPAAIVAPDELCLGSVVPLYDASAGGTWSSVIPGAATIDAVSGVLTAIGGSAAMVKYTLPTGCAVLATIVLNALPAPVVGLIPFTNLLVTDSVYIGYQWYHSIIGIVPDGISFKISGIYNGSYRVVVTDTNGCVGTSVPFDYNTSMGVGSEAVEGAKVIVFPNPAKTELHFSGGPKYSVKLFDMAGRLVAMTCDTDKMDLSAVKKGIYCVLVSDALGEKMHSERVVIE